MIKLYYAPLEWQGDIPEIKLNSKDEVHHWVYETIVNKQNNVVYVIGVSNEIVVTSNRPFISEIFSDSIESVFHWSDNEVFIQEFYSFEEAYKVALSMQEEHCSFTYEPES